MIFKLLKQAGNLQQRKLLSKMFMQPEVILVTLDLLDEGFILEN
jgi:hypothetical protein